MEQFTLMQALLLSLASIFITLFSAWCVWVSRYPAVTGILHTAGTEFDIKRAFAIPCSRVYIRLFGSWHRVDNVKKLKEDYKSTLEIVEKSYWQHICDCGLIYPAVYGQTWLLLCMFFVGVK